MRGSCSTLAHAVADEVRRRALVRLDVRGTPIVEMWHASTLGLGRALPAALALQRFATTPEATQAISSGRAGAVSGARRHAARHALAVGRALVNVTVSVNGVEHTREVEPRLLLVHFLRDVLRLTGTHWGCDTSNCGTCVVLLDGEPVKSCTVLAATAERYEITTVEGIERDGVLDPVQQGFHEKHGLQCGFCTSGMMLTARALLDRNPDPSDDEIRTAISGQICRCTGYATIVRSIRWAANNAGTARACPSGPG